MASLARQDGVGVIGKDNGYFVLVSHGAERNDVAIQSRTTWMASLARQDGIGVIGTDDGISSLRVSRVRRVKRGNPE